MVVAVVKGGESHFLRKGYLMVWLPSPEGEVYFYDFPKNLKSLHCITKRNSQLFHDLAVALEHTCLGECPVIVDGPILA